MAKSPHRECEPVTARAFRHRRREYAVPPQVARAVWFMGVASNSEREGSLAGSLTVAGAGWIVLR